jgi:hypothetical protein
MSANQAAMIVPWRRAVARAPERLPVLCIATLMTVAVVWNSWVGLRWQPTEAAILGPALALLAIAAYAASRSIRQISETSFYLCLWYLFTAFAVRLTYLAFSTGYPLQDARLMAADAAIGFDWVHWSRFIGAHSLVYRLQGLAYMSILLQIPLLVTVSAFCRPRARNAETFIAICVALATTVAIATFVPAIGPGDALGLRADVGPVVPVVDTLRSGTSGVPLPYVGIVAFPSFHTVMAIQFAYALRGTRWLSPTALVLNALVLSSVPANGDHHLVDVLAGSIVAIAGIWIARLLVCTRRNR